MSFGGFEIILVLCLGLVFVLFALAVGALFFKGSKKVGLGEMTARVERLSRLSESLKQELSVEAGGIRKPQSLLSRIDLRPSLSRWTGEAYFQELELSLAQADIPLRVSEFLVLRGALVFMGMMLMVILTKSFAIALLSIIPLALLHKPIIAFKKKKRVNKFSDQLAPFLILVVNSLRAGQTFMQGAEIAAKESPDPIAIEFKQVLKEINLGIPVENAMDNMLIRVPSEDLKIVVAAYTIQRKVGGNLAEIFNTTAETVRERIRIQGQINTLTTQGKLSGVIVAVIPIVIAVIMSFMQPAMMHSFFGSLFGKICIGVVLIMETIGALAIKKIVSIEI